MQQVITIFTPTYNRAHTLRRLYNSLTKQLSYQFEWLIVDDGSTDDTEQLIREFQTECTLFPIRYYKKKNGGKHTAINTGVELAKGFLFFIVDSDDYLTENAVASLISWEKNISNAKMYAGVSGNKGFSENSLIGKTFEEEYIDATSLERSKYSIEGDKAEVFYTDVLRRFPFPVFENERFMTENVVWYRIALNGYKIRWFNEIIYIAEYRSDGLSKNQDRILAENPKGYALSVMQKIECFDFDKAQIDAEYFDYYQTVKSLNHFKDAANYLNISTTQLLRSITSVYFRAGFRKIKNVMRSGRDIK